MIRDQAEDIEVLKADIYQALWDSPHDDLRKYVDPIIDVAIKCISDAGLAIVPLIPTEDMMQATKIPFAARDAYVAMVEKGKIS